jgi:hypothetical protein
MSVNNVNQTDSSPTRTNVVQCLRFVIYGVLRSMCARSKKCRVNATVGQCQCLLPRSDTAGEKGERELLGGDYIQMWATSQRATGH